jgi:RAQPRD family integrative conjugative element protein
MKKQLSIIVTLLGLSMSPLLAHADTQMANQYLQRAMSELAAAKVYVQKAKQQQPSNERVVFHYDWVLSDIDKIQGGIEQKFDMPRIQPRIIKPVKGDYITIVGQGE